MRLVDFFELQQPAQFLGSGFVFYDRFIELCRARNISPSRAATEAGLSKSTVSKWKNEPDCEPSGTVLKKLSEYFGIGISEILNENEQKKEPSDDTDSEMAELLEDFKTNPELRTLFSLGKNASPEDLRTMINVIKAIRGGDEDEHIC